MDIVSRVLGHPKLSLRDMAGNELRMLIDRPFGHAMIQSVRGVGYRLVTAP